MAVYSDLSPTTQFRQTEHRIETNGTATGEANVSSSSGVYVTNLTQDQLKGSLISVKVFGTAHTAIVLIDTDYTPRLVVAGGLAVCSAPGQAILDTATGQTAGPTVTDNKLGIGWYTESVTGKKFLAFCNRLDGVSLAANTIEVNTI